MLLRCPTCGAVNEFPGDDNPSEFDCITCHTHVHVHDGSHKPSTPASASTVAMPAPLPAGGMRFADSAPTAECPEALAGHILQGFRLHGVIGEGPRTIIYAGEQVTLQRPVAIKILKQAHVTDAERIYDFLEAGRQAAALIHPHIVPIIDVLSAGDFHGIVQERQAGQTLHSFVESGGRLRPEEAAHVGIALADALAFAHDRLRFHHNLHPWNVFAGSGGPPVINDFCHRALLGSPRPRGAMELERAMFLAPEQHAGQALLPASDVFSLGAVLYLALTGRAPYPREAFEQFTRGSASLSAPDAHVVDGAVPRRLSQVLSAMLQLDPASRPQTMAAVGEMFCEFLREFQESARFVPSDLVRARTEDLGPPNRRKYKRLGAGIEVELYPQRTNEKAAILLLSKIENLGENGAFVAMETPLPIGAVVTMDFCLEETGPRVHVLGLVRWQQQAGEGQEAGIGVQFIEISTVDQQNLHEYLDECLAEDMARSLTRTALHTAILKLVISNWGKAIPVDVMVQATGTDLPTLRAVIPDFEEFHLVQVVGTTVLCVQPESKRLCAALHEATVSG